MTSHSFLKRIFRAYYRERKNEIPLISSINQREFGFIPWDKEIMIRHMSFLDINTFRNYLEQNAPRHVYSSGSLYLMPENTEMSLKEYQGCDLIIDIDVDHFYTPCKDNHDFWTCQECNFTGKGMIQKCTECGSARLTKLPWICEECLEIAKNEIQKLIFDFLIPDFAIDPNDMQIAFSGHRGYHLKIENSKIRTLTSDERREISDYLTGNNISFEILGLKKVSQHIYGLLKENLDWSAKIILYLEEILKNYSNRQLSELLERFGFNKNVITSFLNSRNDFLKVIQNNSSNIWSVEGFGITNWKNFLNKIADEVGVELDEPVIIDIHRLIRYPGTLHGKTGFKVQKLTLDELQEFTPLNETKNNLDPIVFESSKNVQKIKILEKNVPETKIKGKKYGPYKEGEIIEVPNHIAIFLLSKEVATIL